MIIGIIAFFVIIGIPVILMVRNYNYNHRFGEGLFKDSEYNLDEPEALADKNYYDDQALKKENLWNKKPGFFGSLVLSY